MKTLRAQKVFFPRRTRHGELRRTEMQAQVRRTDQAQAERTTAGARVSLSP